MRRLLGPVLLVFLLLTTACASDPSEVSAGDETTDTTPTIADDESGEVPGDTGEGTEETPAEPEPEAELEGQAEELEKLRAALETWSENGHAQYNFGYGLQCECWQGPWDIVVENGDIAGFTVDDGEPGAEPPYQTVEHVFREIEQTLSEGRVPVRVRYDEETGVPEEYVWNEPELPVDGGFVFVLEYFEVGDAGPDRDAARLEFEAAKALWADAGLTDYDLTYGLGCFCVSVGPFEIEVRDSEVVSVSGPPDEHLDDEFLDDVATTVDSHFELIAAAIETASTFTIRYDDATGYPTHFDVDYSAMIADDEFTHTMELRPV